MLLQFSLLFSPSYLRTVPQNQNNTRYSHNFSTYFNQELCDVYVLRKHFNVCIFVLTSDAGRLVRSQYPEGPATGHLDTSFSWFPCVYKRMLRWFTSFQVATTYLSCSPLDLNFLITFFSYLCTCKITTATG